MPEALYAFSIILIILALMVAYLVTKHLATHSRFNIRTASLEEKWVSNAFGKAAEDEIAIEYEDLGKTIFTKRGEYRSKYIDDVSKRDAEIVKELCSGLTMSEDFCKFVESSYPDIRKHELPDAIRVYREFRLEQLKTNHDAFIKKQIAVTPEEFFKMKELQKGDIVGAYIIYNETKDMPYVGQATRLFFRVNQHFTGHGNGDVYADYKYGDDFSVKLIPLVDSGYKDLDLLEKNLIEHFGANKKGYNKTAGNG